MTQDNVGYFIDRSIKELKQYASVFQKKIAVAFDGIESEAEDVEKAEYNRLSRSGISYEDGDDSSIAEASFFKGFEHYQAINAVRQGVINLMVAGIFHLLEQQSQQFAVEVLGGSIGRKNREGGIETLSNTLKEKIQLDIGTLPCWSKLEELTLTANTVKHAKGNSSKKLRDKNPGLFDSSEGLTVSIELLPLRPLAGEGLKLTKKHFQQYSDCAQQFWKEILKSEELKRSRNTF